MEEWTLLESDKIILANNFISLLIKYCLISCTYIFISYLISAFQDLQNEKP